MAAANSKFEAQSKTNSEPKKMDPKPLSTSTLIQQLSTQKTDQKTVAIDTDLKVDPDLEGLINNVENIADEYKGPNKTLVDEMMQKLKELKDPVIKRSWKNGIALLNEYCEKFENAKSATFLPNIELLIKNEIIKHYPERFKTYAFNPLYRKNYVGYLKDHGFIPHDIILFSNEITEILKAFKTLYPKHHRKDEIQAYLTCLQNSIELFNEDSQKSHLNYILPLTCITFTDDYRQKLISEKSTKLLEPVTRCLDQYFGIKRPEYERYWLAQKRSIEAKADPLTNAINTTKEEVAKICLTESKNDEKHIIAQPPQNTVENNMVSPTSMQSPDWASYWTNQI